MLSIPPPCKIRGSLPFIFAAVQAHRAPWDVRSSVFFFFTILSNEKLSDGEAQGDKGEMMDTN